MPHLGLWLYWFKGPHQGFVAHLSPRAGVPFLHHFCILFLRACWNTFCIDVGANLGSKIEPTWAMLASCVEIFRCSSGNEPKCSVPHYLQYEMVLRPPQIASKIDQKSLQEVFKIDQKIDCKNRCDWDRFCDDFWPILAPNLGAPGGPTNHV